jgi:hypothetical protein
MTLSTHQRLLIGLLLLAGAGLTCDQFFILPKSSEATPIEQTTSLVMNNVPEESHLTTGFKTRLDKRLPTDQIDFTHTRNAFSVTSAWQPPTQPEEVKQPNPHLAGFNKSHRLKAVMIHKNHQVAFVDDDMLRLGDSLDGFTLIDITENAVTFSTGTEQVSLYLDNNR